jgi:periplasmic divalent cation tolerance protein
MCFRLINVAADHDTLPAAQLFPVEPGTPPGCGRRPIYSLFARLTRGIPETTVDVMGEVEPIVAIVTSVGTEQQAVEISEELVARRLATCVNILPCLRSIYHWKGKICSDTEYLLIVKTREALFSAVSEAIRELHSYELPEILQFPIARAEPNFHRWVLEMATGVPDAEEPQEAEVSFD